MAPKKAEARLPFRGRASLLKPLSQLNTFVQKGGVRSSEHFPNQDAIDRGRVEGDAAADRDVEVHQETNQIDSADSGTDDTALLHIQVLVKYRVLPPGAYLRNSFLLNQSIVEGF